MSGSLLAVQWGRSGRRQVAGRPLLRASCRTVGGLLGRQRGQFGVGHGIEHLPPALRAEWAIVDHAPVAHSRVCRSVPLRDLLNMQGQREPTPADDSRSNPSPQRAFALRMRQLREDQGVSQTALAKALERYGLKLDGTTITRIEKNAAGSRSEGARIISLNEAVAISEVLHTSIENMMRPVPSLDEQLKQALQESAMAREQAVVANHNLAETERRAQYLGQRLKGALKDEIDEVQAELRVAKAQLADDLDALMRFELRSSPGDPPDNVATDTTLDIYQTAKQRSENEVETLRKKLAGLIDRRNDIRTF